MRRFLLASLCCLACERPPIRTDVELARAWESETFAGCVLASVQAVEVEGRTMAIAASGDGRVVALDPETGGTIWSVDLPHAAGEIAHVIATPAIVPGPRLVVAWQDVDASASDPAAGLRSGHHAAVIDLARAEIDPAFPLLTFEAEQPSADGSGTVVFSPGNALSRSRLVHASGGELGLVYVSFGNARDIQPWHGWVFELDLDGWRSGSAIRSVLLTTATNDCGASGTSGSSDMRCGGGVWSPAGPVLTEGATGFDLVVPTGNGALDLDTRSYAHTLMRIRGPGLAFDPRCDATACAGFDALAPSSSCLESCEDLFIPRLLPSDPPFDAPGCEGLSFFECYAALDWDLGANSPARVELPGASVYVLPAKDGGVYLLDADHLGTLYDRAQIVDACGTDGASCEANWAGMMVTQPAMTEVDGAPLALISTFMFDDVHPAGVVALRVVMEDGAPRLERAWETPSFESDEARTSFRRHPSAIRFVTFAGEEFAAIVEQGRAGVAAGRLWLIRARDGELAARVELDGPGQRFAQPLAIGERLIMTSCENGNAGPSHIEAWDIRAR